MRSPVLIRGIGGRCPAWMTFLARSAARRTPARWLVHCDVCPRSHSTTPRLHSSGQNSWSYFHGAETTPLLGATIGQHLEWRTNQNPDKEAYVFRHQGVRLSFEQLLEQVDKFAAGLVSLGLEQGDRIGIWAPNCVEWIIVQYASARAGLILVNVNPAYQAEELKYCLLKVGIKALMMPESFKTQSYHKMLSQICPDMEKSPSGKISSKILPDLKFVIMISPKQFPGCVRFSDVMDSANNKQLSYIKDLQDKLQFDDPINIQFTSGTTGNPKGACLTHHNIINNARQVGVRQGFHLVDSKICAPVPLFHCFGMVMASLQTIAHGATCIFPSPSFEPEPCLKAVHDERCTALYGTPTMFIDMLHHPHFAQYDLKSLDTGIMAGSTCPIELLRRTVTNMHMKHLTVCYGMTECSPVQMQTLRTDSLEKRVETVGTAHPNVEVKVIDENGRIVRIGESGEICFRSYGVMLGYWGDPEQTNKVIGKDRWYKTGDIGVLDKEGYLRVVGRIKDMVVRGGENIYPLEIENFLHQHPKISDVQVIGVPDERLEEQVAAWIRLKPGEEMDAQEVKDYCRGKIAHYKIPQYVSFVSEYPLTVTGKVQKYRMREMALTMYHLEKAESRYGTT